MIDGLNHYGRLFIRIPNSRFNVHCVELEERARSGSEDFAEDLAVLRADLHALWMAALRQSDIPFTDRADAARLAFELIRKPSNAAS